MSEAARSRVVNVKHVRGCSIGSSKIHHIDADFWIKKSFAMFTAEHCPVQNTASVCLFPIVHPAAILSPGK